MWNRALSANEVSQLYNGGSGRSYQSTPGITEGSGQTEAWQTQPYGSSTSLWAGATKPAPTAGSQSMSFSYGTAMGACDEVMVALRAASAPTVYAYPQTGYMNPDAVGSLGNGLSTTTYAYDANGMWCRPAAGITCGTTSTACLPAVTTTPRRRTHTTPSAHACCKPRRRPRRTIPISTTRSRQRRSARIRTPPQLTTSGTAIRCSPRSIKSSTTAQQQAPPSPAISILIILAASTPSPTPVVRRSAPGLLSVRRDAGGDKYVSDKREAAIIGQFSDAQTNLDYLNARYYNSTQGQFLSEDPVFWGRQNLADPQSFNVYSYAQGNPIIGKDPTGLSLTEYSTTLEPAGGFSAGDVMGQYRGVSIYSHGTYSPLDDGNIYQCVGFARRFVQGQSGLNLGGIGNAVAYGDQSALNAKLTGSNGMAIAYPNGGAMMPQENDLITWSDGAGNPGHVGVIARVDFNSQKGMGTVWTASKIGTEIKHCSSKS